MSDKSLPGGMVEPVAKEESPPIWNTGGDICTIGIHVGKWGSRIECHGYTEEEAIALRDRVFDAITNPHAHHAECVVERWQRPAAQWLIAKAAEQRATNAKYPDHAACYPAWGAYVTKCEMLASELLTAAQQADR